MVRRSYILEIILVCALLAVAVTGTKKNRKPRQVLSNVKTRQQANYYGYSLVPRYPFLTYLYPQSYLNYSPFSFSQYPTVQSSPVQPIAPEVAASPPTYICPMRRYLSPYQSSPYAHITTPACLNSKYRSYDGSCNNLENPTWGMANTKYNRLLPANYADGIHMPPVSKSRNLLPSARKVSYTIFNDVDIHDEKWTLSNMQWGQLVSHDLALIDGTTQSKTHMMQCCSNEGKIITEALESPLCFPIMIPLDDPVYAREGQQCRNFVRSTTDRDRGCSSGNHPAEQLTVVTHYLDLSIIYGSSDTVAAGLRAGKCGFLTFEARNGRKWLPQAVNKSTVCDVYSESDVCYKSGDVRVNQNPQLTILHQIWHREHNRIAGILATINYKWTDEIIFQVARRIVIAMYQHITYYEWLPITIGNTIAYGRKIIYQTPGYVNDYDATVNPSVINEHSTAASRYFHSAIAGKLKLINEWRISSNFEALRLSDHFNRPRIIEEDNYFDELTIGMATQPEEDVDQFFDKEITNHLFRNHHKLGDDLRAIDIQRNRDHGLASYNDYRMLTGRPKAVQWMDFSDLISLDNINKLAYLYETPDDVDLTVGGSLERHVPGTLVGPTFLYIIAEQFWRTRVGDRYWYETGDPKIAFTIEQLFEIRKASLAKLMCHNADNIQKMQMRAFEKVSRSNPLVDCENIPDVNLSLWKDIRIPYQSSEHFEREHCL